MIISIIIKFIISILIGTIIGLAVQRSISLSINRLNIKNIFLLFILFLVPILLSYFSLLGLKIIPINKVNISINYPTSKTIVDTYRIQVGGSVTPINCRVYVLVHPVSANRWWIQEMPTVLQNNDDGDLWEADVYLGTKEKGLRETFQVIAIASNNSILFDILTDRYFRVGDKISYIPNLDRSNVITIYRDN